MTPKTDSQRQKTSRNKKLDAGLVRKEYWATPENHELLKAKLKQLTKGE